MNKYENSLHNVLDPLSCIEISKFVSLAQESNNNNVLSDEKYNTVIEVADDIIINRCNLSINDGIITINNLNSIIETPVYRGNIENKNIMIACYDDEFRNFDKFSAYFKFLNSDSFEKASKMARITILNPTYINHNNIQGKEKWILNKSERELLNNIMHIRLRGETVWYWTCYEFCRLTKKDIDFGNKIPDFTYIRSEK